MRACGKGGECDCISRLFVLPLSFWELFEKRRNAGLRGFPRLQAPPRPAGTVRAGRLKAVGGKEHRGRDILEFLCWICHAVPRFPAKWGCAFRSEYPILKAFGLRIRAGGESGARCSRRDRGRNQGDARPCTAGGGQSCDPVGAQAEGVTLLCRRAEALCQKRITKPRSPAAGEAR